MSARYGVSACRHCCRKRVSRPRGLCWFCYYRPGVREMYGLAAPRGIGFTGGRRAPEPTWFLPGTPEKLAVLMARAEAGESLFHPDDARG